MISVEVTKEPDSDWNKNLLRSKYGTIYQTVEYAKYVKSRAKSIPNYVKFITSTGELIGQIVIFQSFKGNRKMIKYLGHGFLYSIVSRASSPLLQKYYYWNFGPVVFDQDLENTVSEGLGRTLVSWGGKFNGYPHPLNSNFEFSTEFHFQKKEAGTFLINLQRSLTQISENTDKKSVRKNIERAQERGVTVTQMVSENDFKTYHKILNQHRLENDLISYSLEDVIEGFQILKPLGQIGFLAWHDNIPIAGISISSFNGYINEWGIARSRIDAENNLYSLDLLRWKITEWGVEHGCTFYDLSGIKVKDRSQKEQGIFQNKKKWGGNLVTYPVFST